MKAKTENLFRFKKMIERTFNGHIGKLPVKFEGEEEEIIVEQE